jgi:hypothetical protein
MLVFTITLDADMAQSNDNNVIPIRSRMGRPTKYSDEIHEKALQYIDGGWREKGHNHPSLVGFARSIKVSKQTLYNWGEKHPEFLDTLDELQAEQEFTVLDNALTGDYVAPISKLVLSNHGYSDKVQQDNISSDGSFTFSWEE